MKILLNIMTFICLCIVYGCSGEKNQPVIPTVNGMGILAGCAALEIMEPMDTYYLDMSNTIVSVVGTNITAATNKKGFWSIHNLDSGIYTLRFTHYGFEPMEIPNVISNGKDSMYVMYKVAHSTGPIAVYPYILLLESAGSVSASANGTLSEFIYDGRTTWDTSSRNIDTSFIYNATINTQNVSVRPWTNMNLPVKISFMLSDNAILTTSDFPSDSVFRNTKWTELESTPRIRDSVGKATFVIAKDKYLKGIDIRKQYYLHVLPRWRQLKQWIEVYHDTNAYVTVGQHEVWGNLVSVPVLWK